MNAMKVYLTKRPIKIEVIIIIEPISRKLMIDQKIVIYCLEIRLDYIVLD